MKCNLALYILRECILMAGGESEFHLVWFKKFHYIPNDTFYRHVNSLIEELFIVRTRRDTYKLHWMFLKRMRSVTDYQQKEPISDKQQKLWNDIPF